MTNWKNRNAINPLIVALSVEIRKIELTRDEDAAILSPYKSFEGNIGSYEILEEGTLYFYFLLSFSMADQDITCSDCGGTFTFTEAEQEFYASKNLNSPKRCKACRQARKGQHGDREMHDAVCAKCGSQCQVPFKPRPEAEGGKPVLCKECFVASRA